ncbi:hypothetical protein AB0K60_07220 [Thermopolyspora sp. NPDC052614]|uniref:hypothetical protein n=1 Tax=Thermopolyspora sp. NPDC052614 TaxID=3155682 RepID=UPI003419B5DA
MNGIGGGAALPGPGDGGGADNVPTFEAALKALIDLQTRGRDWQSYLWPPGTSRTVLRQALDATRQLPSWRAVHTLLNQLGAPESSLIAFHAAYERAKLYRPWSETVRVNVSDADQAGTLVINNTGGTINIQPERRLPRRSERVPEPVIEDASGYDLKPDPFTAQTISELEDLAREFWRWAGAPSSRRIADYSRGAFSHATISKIIYDRADKPALKMHYLLGLIRGCGGDAEEQARWITAWRLLNRAGTITARDQRPAIRALPSQAG